MNKLLTFPGIQPIYLGDIDFLQESVRSAFVQLLVGLTGESRPTCILKRPTSTQDGVICIDGEIMPYKAYTGSNILINPSVAVMSVYSSGRVFKSGESHECHEERYAQSGASGTILENSLLTLDQLLFKRIKYVRSAALYDDEYMTKVFAFIRLGDSILADIGISISADVTTEYLFDKILVNIPSSAVSQSPKYCNLCGKIAGSLINIPVEVTFEEYASNPGSSYMTAKINKTTFAAGDAGTLNLTVLL